MFGLLLTSVHRMHHIDFYLTIQLFRIHRLSVITNKHFQSHFSILDPSLAFTPRCSPVGYMASQHSVEFPHQVMLSLNSKSAGQDGINSLMLKITTPVIPHSLATLFNLLLQNFWRGRWPMWSPYLSQIYVIIAQSLYVLQFLVLERIVSKRLVST